MAAFTSSSYKPRNTDAPCTLQFTAHFWLYTFQLTPTNFDVNPEPGVEWGCSAGADDDDDEDEDDEDEEDECCLG